VSTWRARVSVDGSIELVPCRNHSPQTISVDRSTLGPIRSRVDFEGVAK
jgi:hypothetical protein